MLRADRVASAMDDKRTFRALLGVVACLFYLLDSTVARAGCGALAPSLLFPIDGQEAPLNSKITISLGVQRDWVSRVVLRPRRGAAVEVSNAPLPGPLGQVLVQLSPKQPLEPNTQYELAIIRPADDHPNALIFGTFVTGSTSDGKAPTIRLEGSHYFEEADRDGVVKSWLEIGVGTEDGDRQGTGKMFAIWFPDAKGRLVTTGPAALYVRQDASVVRVSSPDLCNGWNVPLPSKLGATEFGLAALDEANNRSAIVRVKVDFRRVEHRNRVP